MFGRCILIACAVLMLTRALPPALFAATVQVCSHNGLEDALKHGGTIRFGCAGPIGITNSLVISRDTVLDASDRTVRLSSVNWNRIFEINPGVTLPLINLSLEHGN